MDTDMTDKTLHHTFHSGPVNDDDSVIKNEDLFDPDSLGPGKIPEVNPNTEIFIPGNDEEDPVEVSLESVIRSLVDDIESTGMVDSVGLESIRGYVPMGTLMDSDCYMPGRSRIHAKHTLTTLKRLLST